MGQSLISAAELLEIKDSEKLIVLDVSPVTNKSSLMPSFDEYMIPGAFIIDLKKELSDPNSDFPNTFPTLEIFNQFASSIGLQDDSQVVVYDNLGIYTSPRLWWVLKTMGFHNVSVLNGGIKQWEKSGGALVERNHIARPNNGTFEGKYDAERVKTYEELEANSLNSECSILDARSEGRFSGKSPEPRPHLRSGHIPSSFNVPFKKVLENGMMKSDKELKDIFSKFKKESKLVFSCGSGISACIILLAAEQVLDAHLSLYDGSWTEWAERQKLFVE